ncbi:MAG TPA: molybdenum ABC transporter ATP-binding protein [Steroidobacteraceae bacterium]
MIEVALKKRRGSFALDVAFRTSDGEADSPGVIALFGPSGCGKTTTVHAISGLLRPDAGIVRIGDATLFDSMRGIDVPAERRRIGYVFQDARLFPHLDVLKNLRYGAKRTREEGPPIDFDEVVDLLGLEPLLSRSPRRLSGGERQRVALGRALLCRPRLLLLDEPLASLDVARRAELLPYLERLRDRLSVPMIYVSHQFEEVLRLATHVVLLEAGRVVAAGDVAAVSVAPELRAAVGSDALGAVVEGEIEAVDTAAGLARLRVGAGTLMIQADELAPRRRVRVQLLARDLILGVEPPRGLSVRNCLEGTLVRLAPDAARTQLVEIDIGGPRLIAQVTTSASTELNLRAGQRLWVLVKTVSLRGHVYPAVGALRAPQDAEAPHAPARVAEKTAGTEADARPS